MDYGRVFELSIPTSPTPVEQSVTDFGITFGGQCMRSLPGC